MCAEWHALTPIADFDRDISFFWRRRRVPFPGECILLAQQFLIDGISYEDLVHFEYLKAEYREPRLVYDTEAKRQSGEILDNSTQNLGPSMSHGIVSRKMDAFAVGHQPGLRQVNQRFRR